jgi:hypothetical protein
LVRRAPIATFAPAFDSANAVAKPIPLLAPVIIATLFLIIKIHLIVFDFNIVKTFTWFFKNLILNESITGLLEENPWNGCET